MIDGKSHLAISIPLHSDLSASDLKLIATRSEDLSGWSEAGVLPHDQWEFDPVTCIGLRTFFSETEFGTIPKEFMRFEMIPSAP